MEFNNSTGSRLPNQQPHHMIFFQQQQQQSTNQTQNSYSITKEFVDEQEVAYIRDNNEEDYGEEGVVNEQINKTKHPFNSSELFNAFNNDSFRENQSYQGQKKWIKDFSPNKELKENQSRGQSVLQSQQQQNAKYSQILSNKNPQLHNYQQQQQFAKQSNQQQKIFFGPLQVDGGNYKNKSDILDDYNSEGIDYEDDDDIDNNNQNQDAYYDQEHLMTEQDFDGHQHQDQEFSQEEEELQQEYERESVEEDDNGEDEEQDGKQYNDNQQSDMSQEENVIESSKSVSPEKKQQMRHEVRKSSYIEQQYCEDDFRVSNIRQSNMESSYGDIPMNNGNMIVERNDRFIIFKMVPQANLSGVKQSQTFQKNQPTPAMGERYIENPKMKPNSETVEDIDSEEEESKDVDEQYKSYNQDNCNMMMDESCQEDEAHSVSQNDIRLLKNQLNNQSMSLNKPPIAKRMTIDSTASNQQRFQYQKSMLTQNHSNQNNSQVLKELQQEDQKQEMQLKKSFTSNSRSSSEKFNKLEKLEKKNLQEEFLEGVEFPMAKGNQNKIQMIEKQSSFNKPQELIQPSKINERRQSDCAILRNSNLQQQNQLVQQQQIKQVFTQNSNVNTAHTAAIDTSSNDPETELLKMEYMKLKKTLNKLKNEPQQQTARKDASKQGRQQEPFLPQSQTSHQQRSQPQTIKTQRLEDQKSQVKSKKNLKMTLEQQQQYTSNNNNQASSHLSEDEDKRQYYQAKHNKGAYSQQQSTKAKDGKGKNLFKQEPILPKQQLKRDMSKSRIQNKLSPQRDQNKNFIQKQQHQRKNSKYNKLAHNDDSESSLHRSLSSYSSPDKSYRTYQKAQIKQQKPNINTKSQGKLTVRQPQKNLNDQNNFESSGDHDHHDDSEDNSETECFNDHSVNQRRAPDESYQEFAHLSDEQKDSYYDSNDDDSQNRSYYNEDDENDSNQYSESNQSSEEDHSQNRKKPQAAKKGKQQQQIKVVKKAGNKKTDKQTITASNRDRKLKININMNGAQFSRQARKEMHNSQDEYLQKQRQLLQQQQYFMAMAQQYPQQQLMIQQQLALQQQMLIQQQQPSLQLQNQFMNLSNIPSSNNLVGMNSNNIDQLLQHQLNQHSQNLSNNTSVLIQKNMIDESNLLMQQQQNEEQLHGAKLLQKNLSGNNIGNAFYNQGSIITGKLRTTFNNEGQSINDISPSRSILQNNLFDNNAFSQMTSPRDLSGQRKPELSSQQQNPNYLNQIKNRFLISNPQNIPQSDQPSDSIAVISRNQLNQMSQNNSSPLKQQREQQYQRDNNFQKESQTSYKQENQQEYINRFEEARKFAAQQTYYNKGINQESQRQTRKSSNNEQQQQSREDFEYEQKMQYYRQNDQEDQQQFDMSMKFPKLEQKKTGDFGLFNDKSAKASPKQRKENQIFAKARNVTESPNNSNDNCDLSIDEGVKASNAHETMLRSPRTSAKDFKISIINAQKSNSKVYQPDTITLDFSNSKQKQNTSIRQSLCNNQKKNSSPSLVKQLSLKVNEQDKKGPQALMIGFDDETQLKDPFSNKPKLKPKEEKIKDLVQRSKSTKGVMTTIEPSSKKISLAQRRQEQKQGSQTSKNHDKQLRSPISSANNKKGGDSSNKKTIDLANPQVVMLQNQSPLKRVVLDLKLKEPVPPKKTTQIQKHVVHKLAVVQKEEEQIEDFTDPSHNQNIAIEIFDKKQKSTGGSSAKPQEVSLAEMFRAKKKEAAVKATAQKQQDQDHQQDEESNEQDKPNKKEKSKEELFELRKKMMKSRVTRKENNFTVQGVQAESGKISTSQDKNNQKDPQKDLMARLANGQKVTVRILNSFILIFFRLIKKR